jgi:acylphosphatase
MSYKCIRILYSGHVQGVGFRYTAQDIASGLGLVGWVRNLSDGRVEVVSEGEEKKIKQFLERLEKGFLGRYIRDTDISWKEPTGEFDNFDIRF